jgi:hypothetical protein
VKRLASIELAACALVVALAGCSSGCSSTVEVTRFATPPNAARLVRGGKLVPKAVVRDKERIPLSTDAKIEADKVTVPLAHGVFVYHLRSGDVIELDADDRISAVRMPTEPPSWIRFAPGTATSPEGTDEVRGKLAQGESTVPLRPTDKIEMFGTFSDGERVPGGGHVESTRSTIALLAGSIILGLAYLPSAYFGAASSRKGDRILLLPVFGPWIDLLGRDKCVPPDGSEALPVDPCIEETANRVAIVASGIAQALGSVLFAVGVPSRAVFVEDDPKAAKRTAPSAPVPQTSWRLAPMVTPHGASAFVVGAF